MLPERAYQARFALQTAINRALEVLLPDLSWNLSRSMPEDSGRRRRFSTVYPGRSSIETVSISSIVLPPG